MNNKTNKLSTKSKQVSEPTEPSGKHTPDPKFKRFYLRRKEDISGVSGVGIVAEGIQFSDGTCVLKWTTETSSMGIYHSHVELIHIHGHMGATILEFVDE